MSEIIKIFEEVKGFMPEDYEKSETYKVTKVKDIDYDSFPPDDKTLWPFLIAASQNKGGVFIEAGYNHINEDISNYIDMIDPDTEKTKEFCDLREMFYSYSESLDAKKNKKSKKGKKSKEFAHFDDFDNLVKDTFTVRMNEITKEIYIFPSSGKEYIDLIPGKVKSGSCYDNVIENVLISHTDQLCSNIGLKFNPKTFYSYMITKAHFNKFNPILDYLEGVRGLWTPDKPDEIGKLCDYFTFSKNDDNDNRDRKFFKRSLEVFLSGMILKIFIQDHQNITIILKGAQGKGKSTFVKWLCPLREYFKEGLLDPKEKDHRISLTRNWLFELSEAKASTRNSIEAMKSLLTTSYITERLPYDRREQKMKVVCSFIGDDNNSTFLYDNTGSRRFVGISILNINPKYQKEINLDLLFSQALYYCENVKLSYKTQFSSKEKSEQAERNKQFEPDSEPQEIFEDYFEITGNQEDRVSNQQIREIVRLKLSEERNSRLSYKWLTDILKNEGAVKSRDKKERFYSGVKLKNI